jgi:cytochrome c oxidase cbb3-type subunit IV
MDVDLNLVRSAVTVVSMVAFLVIVAWAWSARRKADFDAVAAAVLTDDEAPAASEAIDKVDVSKLQCAAWAGSAQAGHAKRATTHHHSTAFKAGYGSMS